MIIFTVTLQEWEAMAGQEFFSSPSLSMEGFVHCCYPEQVQWVLNKHYKQHESVRLICIDEKLLSSELRVEDLKGQGETFPHVYGPINTSAVTETLVVQRETSGDYLFSR